MDAHIQKVYVPMTETGFYILLCLHTEQCGTDIMNAVKDLTGGRVTVGPGTLYHLLDQFLSADMIRETRSEGRQRWYLLTDKGCGALRREYQRLCRQTEDYRRLFPPSLTP